MLRISYEIFESGVRGRIFEQFKTLVPNSRLTYELQEVTTNYKIRLRTSRIDYDSATNPKIYQFMAIRGSSGRSGISSLEAFLQQLAMWLDISVIIKFMYTRGCLPRPLNYIQVLMHTNLFKDAEISREHFGAIGSLVKQSRENYFFCYRLLVVWRGFLFLLVLGIGFSI